MLKEEIDDGWPLVLQREQKVLQVSRQISTRCRAVLRIDRAALVRMYDPSRDFNDLARHFGVSAGSINNALSRLVRIARELERGETLGQASRGKRYVVIVPVDHEAEGQYVLDVLSSHEFTGVVEELDRAEDWRLDASEMKEHDGEF